MLLIITSNCRTRVFQIRKLKILVVKVGLFKKVRALLQQRYLSKLFFFYPQKLSASIDLLHFWHRDKERERHGCPRYCSYGPELMEGQGPHPRSLSKSSSCLRFETIGPVLDPSLVFAIAFCCTNGLKSPAHLSSPGTPYKLHYLLRRLIGLYCAAAGGFHIIRTADPGAFSSMPYDHSTWAACTQLEWWATTSASCGGRETSSTLFLLLWQSRRHCCSSQHRLRGISILSANDALTPELFQVARGLVRPLSKQQIGVHSRGELERLRGSSGRKKPAWGFHEGGDKNTARKWSQGCCNKHTSAWVSRGKERKDASTEQPQPLSHANTGKTASKRLAWREKGSSKTTKSGF